MPKRHVSIARLCDWSTENSQSPPMSQIYRDISKLPRGHIDKLKNKEKNLLIAPSSRPGRMFVRDKNSLTKGEKEIIDGIFNNRKKLTTDMSLFSTSNLFRVKCHKDAWVIGKQITNSFIKSDSVNLCINSNNMRSNSYTERVARTEGRFEPSREKYWKRQDCGFCQRSSTRESNIDEIGTVAPPSSPSEDHSFFSRDSSVNNDDYIDDNARTYINVYVPQMEDSSERTRQTIPRISVPKINPLMASPVVSARKSLSMVYASSRARNSMRKLIMDGEWCNK